MQYTVLHYTISCSTIDFYGAQWYLTMGTISIETISMLPMMLKETPLGTIETTSMVPNGVERII